MNVYLRILTAPAGVFRHKFAVNADVVKADDGFHVKIPYLKVLNSYGHCTIVGVEAEIDGRVVARQMFDQPKSSWPDGVVNIGESEIVLDNYTAPQPVYTGIPRRKMLEDMYKTHKPTPAERDRFKETLYDLFGDEEFDYGKPTGLKRIDDGL